MGVEWGGSAERHRLRLLLATAATVLLLTLTWVTERTPEHATCTPAHECTTPLEGP